MNKMLLVVDPQIDFIDGTLSVAHANEAMENLGRYIQEHDGEYALKVCTLDWHPSSHCSFVENGGEWPRHCVAYSMGASVWPAVFASLQATKGDNYFLTKGTQADREEYSIFKNFASASALMSLAKQYSVEQIDICGIAYDVCVFNTIKDGIKRFGGSMLRVLTDFAPSITEEGAETVNKFLIENQIQTVHGTH